MLTVQKPADDYVALPVNRLRTEVGRWRDEGYAQTMRTTRELLGFWFGNEEREATQQLFFAQREAIETAIWLNEGAEKSNAGNFLVIAPGITTSGISSRGRGGAACTN